MNDADKLTAELERVFAAEVSRVEDAGDGVYRFYAKRHLVSVLDKTPYMSVLGKMVEGRPVFAESKYNLAA